MKSANIVKKLEKEGYIVEWKKWRYWMVPSIKLKNGDIFYIAETTGKESIGLNLNFIFNQVLHAISIAENINPILDKKINQDKINNYWYSMYKILNMGDYYLYRKDKFPYNESWDVLQRLNREFK